MMTTLKKYEVILDDGSRIALNTGEIFRADGARPILSGQPLTTLIALVEAHGLPVSEATFHTRYGVADPRKVISTLRLALGDSTMPFYYILNVRSRGWRLAHYELVIEELPLLDISPVLLPAPSSDSPARSYSHQTPPSPRAARV